MLLGLSIYYVLVMQCGVSSINIVLVQIVMPSFIFSFSYYLHACSCIVNFNLVVALVANK